MRVLLGEDRERDRDQISRALNWPVFPILPVKRPVDGSFPELGVVYFWHSPGVEPGNEGGVRVYLANMFEFKHSAEQPAAERFEYRDYADLDAFFDDGWRGD